MPGALDNTMAALGVPADEERLFRAVMSMSGKSVTMTAGVVGIDPDDVRRRLATCEQLGLVEFADDKVFARAPMDAIADLAFAEVRAIREAADRLEAVRDALPSVRQAFPSSLSVGDRPLDGESKLGGDIPSMLVDWIEGSDGDLCWMRPDQYAMSHEGMLTRAVAEAIAAGRTCRAIYPVRALEDAPENLRARAEAGEQVRIAAVVPTRLAIIGDGVALLQESFGLASSRRLVVREPGVLDAVHALFELYWERAIEVPGLDNPTGERRRVARTLLLQLLADGAKDERIARTLGWSLRTVRRRVAELMDEFHVETRFQAGVEAVRRGLL